MLVEADFVRLGRERIAYTDLSFEIYALAEINRYQNLRCHRKNCCAVTAQPSGSKNCTRLENFSHSEI